MYSFLLPECNYIRTSSTRQERSMTWVDLAKSWLDCRISPVKCFVMLPSAACFVWRNYHALRFVFRTQICIIYTVYPTDARVRLSGKCISCNMKLCDGLTLCSIVFC